MEIHLSDRTETKLRQYVSDNSISDINHFLDKLINSQLDLLTYGDLNEKINKFEVINHSFDGDKFILTINTNYGSYDLDVKSYFTFDKPINEVNEEIIEDEAPVVKKRRRKIEVI